MAYWYDKEFEVMAQLERKNIPLRVRSRKDIGWTYVPNKDHKYEEYSEAILIGEGCWDRLEKIPDDDAKKIIKDWLTETLVNHKHSDEEMTEAEEIVKIIRKEGFSYIDSGCPIHKSDKSTAEEAKYYSSGLGISVVAIKGEQQGFNYFCVETGDKGYYRITDFQDMWLPRYEKEMKERYKDCAIPNVIKLSF